MLYSYQELEEMKKEGFPLNWDEITKEQLEKLFLEEHIPNGEIARLYNVSSGSVSSKRQRWNITFKSAKYLYRRYVEENSEMFTSLNQSSKERLFTEENIDFLAKAITQYVFRTGPVEDMHRQGKLEENDMKILNKYIANKMAGLLKLAMDGEWLKLELLCNTLRYYSSGWDQVEMDTTDIEQIFKNKLGLDDSFEEGLKL